MFCKGCTSKRWGLNWPASKPLTAGTEYWQQETQAMNSVSWRRLHNFSCRYVQDITDTNNFLNATDSENCESLTLSSLAYRSNQSDRARGIGAQKSRMSWKNIIPKNYVSCRILLRVQCNWLLGLGSQGRKVNVHTISAK